MDKINVTITGAVLIDAIYDAIGDDFDSMADFEKAARAWGAIEIEGALDRYELEETVTDEWIGAQYEERFPEHPGDRDVIAGVEELARGNHAMARTLFDRAGQEELSRVI